MKNIHILPTDKPSKLFYNVGGALLFTNYENHNGVNIYITSDEEIKEGDWYLNNEHLLKCTELKIRSACKKIILTTDQDLIKDGVQAIDDEFLEWFVKNPSYESVDIKELISRNGRINFGYQAVIPKEEAKQETTFEEAVKPLMKWLSENTHPHTTLSGFVSVA